MQPELLHACGDAAFAFRDGSPAPIHGFPRGECHGFPRGFEIDHRIGPQRRAVYRRQQQPGVSRFTPLAADEIEQRLVWSIPCRGQRLLGAAQRFHPRISRLQFFAVHYGSIAICNFRHPFVSHHGSLKWIILEISQMDQYFPNHQAIAMSYANRYRAARILMETHPFAWRGLAPKPSSNVALSPLQNKGFQKGQSRKRLMQRDEFSFTCALLSA
jgi:hypothetical protein